MRPDNNPERGVQPASPAERLWGGVETRVAFDAPPSAEC